MSDRAHMKAQAQQKTLTGSLPKSSLLQRTCACGQRTLAGGECSTCRGEQSTLLRSQRAFEPPSAPGTVPGKALTQEQGTSFNSAFDRTSRFAHDFSWIPVYAKVPVKTQTKLTVDTPGDVYEQEADRIADQVMATSADPAVSGAPPHIQRFAGQPTGPTEAAPTSVDQTLASAGRPLEPTLRQDMERRFGHDFSRVRVHSDAAAEQSARDVNAHAYTVDHDIVFGRGRYRPETQAGKWLLAHELTHVIQQDNTTSHNDFVHRAPAPKHPAFEDCTESTTTVSNPQRESVRSLDLAQRFVNGAIYKLDVDPVTEAKDSSYRIAQERHFLSPNKDQRMALRNNFQALLDKLKPENIRCASKETDQDYCSSNPEGGRMAAFMRDGQTFLCYNFWALDSKCKAISLIHEAAHAIGLGTAKHPPYRGSAEYPFGAGLASKDETAAIRMGNPDAYGYFAAHIWRDIDTECRALVEMIQMKGSAPAPAVSGESKGGK